MKQPSTAHPTITPIHHSADPILADHEANDDLSRVERRLCGTVILLKLPAEPAQGLPVERRAGDVRLALRVP
jgi:hypothetical protein